MVATFLDLNRNRPGPANIAEKIDMYDFPVPDCTEEQNGSKWPSLSRTIVELQKFAAMVTWRHASLYFSEFLWVSRCERVFSQTVKK